LNNVVCVWFGFSLGNYKEEIRLFKVELVFILGEGEIMINLIITSKEQNKGINKNIKESLNNEAIIILDAATLLIEETL
jgi:hypothetical protein